MHIINQTDHKHPEEEEEEVLHARLTNGQKDKTNSTIKIPTINFF